MRLVIYFYGYLFFKSYRFRVLKRRSDSPNEEDRGARGDASTENHKVTWTYII